MGDESPIAAREGWRRLAEHRALAHLDRAELDLLFGSKHDRVSDYRFPRAERRTLRADPLIRLLISDPARGPPRSWALRFCRSRS